MIAVALILAACTSSTSPTTTTTVPATTSTSVPAPVGVRAFELLAQRAARSSYVASYRVTFPGGTLLRTTVAHRGNELMWLMFGPVGTQEFIKTNDVSYLCQELLHKARWSCVAPAATSPSGYTGLWSESEPRVLYRSLPSLRWQTDETARVTLEHRGRLRLTCLHREWDADPAYTSTWCVTSAGIFASAVLEYAAMGPKYQVVTLSSYSRTFNPSLFVPPAIPKVG
jgi:hypothetical protein